MASLNVEDEARRVEGAPPTLHCGPRQAPSSPSCSSRPAPPSPSCSSRPAPLSLWRSSRPAVPFPGCSSRPAPPSPSCSSSQAPLSPCCSSKPAPLSPRLSPRLSPPFPCSSPRQAASKLGHSAVQASPPLTVRRASHLWNASLNFNNRKCIGKYSTTNDGTYSDLDTDTAIPRLIPDVTNGYGTNLSTGRSEAVVIPNYKDYHNQKQELLKWIHDNDFFTGVTQGKYKKPEFISSGGCIVYPMMTPSLAQNGDWEIYAAKIRDVIYLWGDKLTDSDGSIESYYGLYFAHLLTHENSSASIPNQFKKVYSVNDIRFGSHQLLCASDVKAEDDKSRLVEFKVFNEAKEKYMETKQLKFWAQSVVTGAEFMVLGTRDDNGDLCHIETTKTDDLAHRFHLSPACYYDFQDRLLTWIKSHFQESNAEKIKKISWPGLSTEDSSPLDVRISDVPKEEIPEAFLPKWYVKSLAN